LKQITGNHSWKCIYWINRSKATGLVLQINELAWTPTFYLQHLVSHLSTSLKVWHSPLASQIFHVISKPDFKRRTKYPIEVAFARTHFPCGVWKVIR